MKFKSFIRQLVNFGMADILNEEYHAAAPANVVAAGNPLHSADEESPVLELDESDVEGLSQFVVSGCSMSPLGIDDRDNLLAQKVTDQEYRIADGDFLVIKVDPDYYENEIPSFVYKLRCAIMPVHAGMQDAEIIEVLKSMDSQAEIWSKDCQQCLKDKLRKARAHYPTDDLVLSKTFKNGSLRYSFHKVDAIEYIAVKLVKADSVTKIIPLKAA